MLQGLSCLCRSYRIWTGGVGVSNATSVEREHLKKDEELQNLIALLDSTVSMLRIIDLDFELRKMSAR